MAKFGALYGRPMGLIYDIPLKYNRLITAPGESVFEAAHRFHLFDLGDVKARNKTLPLYDKQDLPVEIKVDGPVEIVSDDVKRICKIMDNQNYHVSRDDQKNFNLNIVGIRNDSCEPNKFDDEIWVFWRFDNKWTLKKYKATTDPGITYLQNPVSSSGTAILKEGQYLKAYRLGKHKGQYTALVQSQPVTVVRDFNRDNKLDFSSGKEQTGFFGINIHRSSPTGESTFVNNWSAGCQVFARIWEYDEFIGLCKKAMGEWGDEFTYSLINRKLLL
jgi:hypothetical protein